MTELSGLSGARVVVTGGCGLIGSRIGRRLAQLGAHTVALDGLDAYPFDYATLFEARDAYHEIVTGSVADPQVVSGVVAGADYVVHAAAYADVAACTHNTTESTHTNVTGTQVVLDAVARLRPARFVFVSSASVYGHGPAPGTRQCWDERVPTRPISVYANAKLWGEWQTRLQLAPLGVPHVSLRYFSVYGEPQVPKPRSHSWCLAWFGFQAALGLPLRLNGGGQQIRDFIHVDDVAEATVRALVVPEADGQVINVGTGTPTAVADIAGMVCEQFPEARTVVAPGPHDDPLGGFTDTTLMRRVLGFTPSVAVADGVRRYLAWLGRSDVTTSLGPLVVGDAAGDVVGASHGGPL